MNKLEVEDIKRVAELPYPWDLLTGKTLLLSGGSGFIGSFLCEVIRCRNKEHGQGIRIISLSRRKHEDNETVTYVSADVNNPITLGDEIDYVLHLASNTHPEQYASDPIGTITGNVFGTYNLLTLSAQKRVKRFLLASSCEIYGDGKDMPMDEKYCGYLDCNTARAGYNEGKRVSEALCQAFRQQEDVPIGIVRLSRVFGFDKTKKDSKAMAQFLRSACAEEDIVLKSKGLQKYSYVYVADAVSGILSVLFKGKDGEAYNVSADYEEMTLGEYAEFIASLGGVKVVYDIEDNPNASRANNALLDISKIKEIGYKPLYSVKEGLRRTFTIMKDETLI